ncbi:MAG: hypothetical protein BGO31_15685 [Bacteroidetes bacterium 43-16]|nr:MAG: hypothetical protein BGO31_15685 [Bacteroidetes bacterium 43-16]
MKQLLFLLFLFIFTGAYAQQGRFRGFIKSSDDFEPVSLVQVKNVQTGQIVWSDETGYFELAVLPGTKLEFSRVGITTKALEVSPQMLKAIQQILLKYEVSALDAVTVKEKTQYQLDSAERYDTYRLTLERKKDKAEVIITPIGIVVANPVSSWMQYLAPKTKGKLKFQKNFKEWEEQKFIATKYTEATVQRLTGLKHDSLAHFMNRYQMTYEMARAMTEREIAYWINVNYAAWDKQFALLKTDSTFNDQRD